VKQYLFLAFLLTDLNFSFQFLIIFYFEHGECDAAVKSRSYVI